MITAEIYERKTGQRPKQDDLARANCPYTGELGHWMCGWCVEHDLPRFMCGDLVKTVAPITSASADNEQAQ